MPWVDRAYIKFMSDPIMFEYHGTLIAHSPVLQYVFNAVCI